MNYAAINLQFRGYAEAQKGYQAASGIRRRTTTRLGLASHRGQLDFHLTTKQSMERRLAECTDPDKANTPVCQEANAKFPSEMKDHEQVPRVLHEAISATRREVARSDARGGVLRQQRCSWRSTKRRRKASSNDRIARPPRLQRHPRTSSREPKYTKLVRREGPRDEAEKSEVRGGRGRSSGCPPPPPPASSSSAKCPSSAAPSTSRAPPLPWRRRPRKVASTNARAPSGRSPPAEIGPDSFLLHAAKGRARHAFERASTSPRGPSPRLRDVPCEEKEDSQMRKLLETSWTWNGLASVQAHRRACSVVVLSSATASRCADDAKTTTSRR